jgi:hypothetical protein
MGAIIMTYIPTTQAEETSSWVCFKGGTVVGNAYIWWGHSPGDALFACNEWEEGCAKGACDKVQKVLDHQLMYIINKQYDPARLAQDGDKDGPLFTHTNYLTFDQQWHFLPSQEQPGYYYIENIGFPNYRIAKWGPGDRDTGVYSGDYMDDQLWYPDIQSDGYFTITNRVYNARLAKWGPADEDVGSYDASGPILDDQKWILDTWG